MTLKQFVLFGHMMFKAKQKATLNDTETQENSRYCSNVEAMSIKPADAAAMLSTSVGSNQLT